MNFAAVSLAPALGTSSSYLPALPLHCASPALFLPSAFQNLLLPPFPAISTASPDSSSLLLRPNIHRCFLHPPPKLVQKLRELLVALKIQKSLYAGEGNRNICLFAVTLDFIARGSPSDFQRCLPHHQLVYLTSDLCFHNIVPLLKGISPKTPSFGGFFFHLCHVQSQVPLPPLHPLPCCLSDPSRSLGLPSPVVSTNGPKLGR